MNACAYIWFDGVMLGPGHLPASAGSFAILTHHTTPHTRPTPCPCSYCVATHPETEERLLAELAGAGLPCNGDMGAALRALEAAGPDGLQVRGCWGCLPGRQIMGTGSSMAQLPPSLSPSTCPNLPAPLSPCHTHPAGLLAFLPAWRCRFASARRPYPPQVVSGPMRMVLVAVPDSPTNPLHPHSPGPPQSLPYLNAVLNEAMRMFPAGASASPRLTEAPTTRVGPYNLPAGTFVFPFLYLINNWSGLWEKPMEVCVWGPSPSAGWWRSAQPCHRITTSAPTCTPPAPQSHPCPQS